MTMRHCATILCLAATIATATAEVKPRLVVFIAVDQMRADYLDRFSDRFDAGFLRLFREGTFYSNATLNYASTVTCLGHATLSTGAYPGTSGILDNEWIDPRTHASVYCVEDTTAGPVEGEGGGCSPKNLRVSALGDWLKASSPSSKVIAASGKDRAAIMMGGQKPDGAYWYDRKRGHMVTSAYYVQKLPTWVKKFNVSGWVDHTVPDVWTKLLPDSVYQREGDDEASGETPWNGSTSFPHPFESGKKNERLLSTPFGDHIIIDFARAAVAGEKMGQRDATDILCLSFSCLDYIGHAFGPNSHEVLDHLLRLDRALGGFIAELEALVGKDRLMVVLSADHGVMPLPEFVAKHPGAMGISRARRLMYDEELKPALDSLERKLQRRFGVSERLLPRRGYLDYAPVIRAGYDSVALEEAVREYGREIKGIAGVYFRRELAGGSAPGADYLDEFRRSYYVPLGEDFQVRFEENTLITSSRTGTSHGSVYRYDAHVPVLFWGPGIAAARIDRPVHTVDVAPTVARWLGIAHPATVDGTALTEIVGAGSR